MRIYSTNFHTHPNIITIQKNKKINEKIKIKEKIMDKKYSSQNIEKRIYQNWLDKKYFHAEVKEGKKSLALLCHLQTSPENSTSATLSQ